MVKPTQNKPVISFSDNTANDTTPTTANNPMQHLPTTGMGRAKDILPFLPFSKTTLFEWSKDGRFPAPVKLSPTMTAWSYAGIHAWLKSHTSTTSEVQPMLNISNSTIRMIKGLYSLDDLHKASGSNKNYKANKFTPLQTTQRLIDQIDHISDTNNHRRSTAYQVIQDTQSKQQDIYAIWTSPIFQLLLTEAFDPMVSEQQLSDQLNKLCKELDRVDHDLTTAGRFLCIAGKQLKPKLKRHINSTLRQMQLTLELVGGTDIDK